MREPEHNHQVALFVWASTIRELQLMHAVPNGGYRHIRVASKMKKEGVKAGVPDIFLPVSKGGYHGMFIEMKVPKTATTIKTYPNKTQKAWLSELNKNGYHAVIAWGYSDARDKISEYLAL